MSGRTEWMKAVGADGLCFEERLDELIVSSGKTAKEISKETGISESAISDYRNGNRNRAPDSKTILALAAYFKVSTDYLFGLTAADSPDMDVRRVCEYTGLSSATISVLHSLPYTSLRSNFLRRFFDDLIVEHKIDKYVIEDILNSAHARHHIQQEFQSDHQTSDFTGVNTPAFLGNGQYSIPACEVADIYLGNAIGTAQGDIQQVIQDLCSEISTCDNLLPVDADTIRFRWEVYSED